MSRSKDKQDIILQSGICMFIEKGFGKTKIADIAKKAGIGKGTVYEYFDSKEEIFKSCVQYILINYYEEMKLELQKGDTLKESLTNYCKYHYRHVLESGNALYSFRKECNSIVQYQIKDIVLEYRDNIIDIFIKRLEKDNNDLDLTGLRYRALIIIGSVNQFVLDLVIESDDNRDVNCHIDKFIEELIELFTVKSC